MIKNEAKDAIHDFHYSGHIQFSTYISESR